MHLEDNYKNKTVLVTGGAGAIGRNLSEGLALLGAKKVIIIDNLSSAYRWNIPGNSNILFIEGDIRNENDLFRAFHHRPQIIFHLASFFANQNSIDYPLVNEDVNINGLIRLLELSVLSNNVERFVFANSEGGAYGDKSSLPYSEEDICIDLGSPYYISKLSGEAYVKYYFRQYGLPVSIVRLFNSYGPGEVPGQYRNVIPNFIFWALKQKPLPLTGNEEMSRDFVFVTDIVEGILKAGCSDKAIGEAFNICTGKAIRIHDLAEMINSKTKNQAGVTVSHHRKWDRRVIVQGDPSKAEQSLNFKAGVEFEKGIELTIEWFKKHWDQITESAEFPPGINSALDDQV